MRWMSTPKTSPLEGELRTKLRFALWPTRCYDGTRVWLETYWETRQFDFYYDPSSRTWRPGWALIERRPFDDPPPAAMATKETP